MRDDELINFLIDATGGAPAAARALGGVTTKRMFNWRRRGIPFRYRPAFFIVANRHGAKLPRSWLDQSVPSVVEPQPNWRKTNGGESPKQRAQKAIG